MLILISTSNKQRTCKDSYCKYYINSHAGETLNYRDSLSAVGLCSRTTCIYSIPDKASPLPRTPYFLYK